MDRDILKSWIGDPDSAPAEQRGAALAARAFLASDDVEAHAGDIAALPGQIATALVFVLEGAADVERLAVVKAHASDRAARKAAGKALHRLRSRGVAVPEGKRPSGRKVDIGRPAPPPSWMTYHDASGSALTILGEWDAAYGPFFVLAVESEARGLEMSDFVRGATRKMERELMREMELEDRGVPVTTDTARALIEAAARRARDAGTPLPEGWDRVAPFLAGADVAQANPSVALPEDDWVRALQPPPAPLMAIVGDWFPDRPTLDTTMMALHTAASSQLAVSELQRTEFVHDALARQMEAWFDADRRAAWAQRFERAALLLDHRKEPAAAVAALASARWLRDADRPVAEHPVLRRRWEDIFDVRDLLASFEDDPGSPGEAEGEEPESQPESLIVTP